MAVAELWSAATGRSLGALSSVVSNHGGTLDRLRDTSNSVTDATLEKFARFLADPANWPDREVPEEAKAFAHRVGVTVEPASASPGKAGDITPACPIAGEAA